ncbi:MAG: N-acetylmuramoyl-L-alanine amidase [Verrucomicrobia bacterium]|jgi:N-acetylmuramoyl-L-alanine amidase|nr:N-acetylmuramoyl-L-alanine amidase [Verrucomicrobiota bacterium]MBT7064951.1 N-acetylmuramoyl-L-alanine amidase [Verrucomicrobiota bacterium]MBT7702083.1 N-acetylmuramoyl-L-alanine amidase [Verrucomicrobiota bacterium]
MFKPPHALICSLVLLGALFEGPARASSPLQRNTIDTLARRYGFGAPLNLGAERALRSNYSTVVFTAGSRKLRFNDTLIWLNGPTATGSRDWTVTRRDADTILDPLLRPSATVGGDDITTIVLDPGHGGADSGAVGHRRIYEKKAVLDIALRVRDILKAQGITVRMTRDRDYFVPLSKRTSLAKQWGADLFVSIHLNASSNTSVTGIETYVCSSAGFASTMGGRADPRAYSGNHFDKKNTLLGYYLHRGMLKQVKATDRGIKHARFEVLRSAPCPAVLLECGFISNKYEAARVISRTHRESLARGIVGGIMSYIAKTQTGP